MATKQTIDLSPARVDLKLVHGDTWKISFTFPESAEDDAPGLDLTGSTWIAQIRESDSEGALDPEGAPFASFDIDTVDQDQGVVLLHLDESVTTESVIGAFYWYDLQQTKDNDVATPIQGRITVLPDVTQED